MSGDSTNLFRALKKCLYSGQVVKNADLSKLSSFRIGGRCKYLVVVTSIEEILKVTELLRRRGAKYVVLGNGTNTLFSSHGYDGVVLKISPTFAYIERFANTLVVDGGANFNSVLAYASSLGLKGLEQGAGIPGSVGGMVVMNAGAFDFEMSKVVTSVLALVDGKIKHFTNAECEFGYRKSVFQSLENAIILRVEFSLCRGKVADIKKQIATTLAVRAQKQPQGVFSCGSVFKRVEGVVVSKLLDDDGYKGMSVGGASVSYKHANVIINNANATSDDVLRLIEIIKNEVYAKHNILLTTEIKYVQ